MSPEAAAYLSNTINGIIAAGLEGFGNPLFCIYAPNGELTDLNAAQMSPADIAAMVSQWFGDDIGHLTARLPQLTVH